MTFSKKWVIIVIFHIKYSLEKKNKFIDPVKKYYRLPICFCWLNVWDIYLTTSTIRTPYFCKLFHYLFITFVFLFFLFWSKCQIHSCLAGVIIYRSKSFSEFFTPQNDDWIIIWHFWRVFDTLFLYYLHITLLFSCLALGRFSAIPKKDQYIFDLSFLGNTRIVKSDSDQSTVQTGELFHIKS